MKKKSGARFLGISSYFDALGWDGFDTPIDLRPVYYSLLVLKLQRDVELFAPEISAWIARMMLRCKSALFSASVPMLPVPWRTLSCRKKVDLLVSPAPNKSSLSVFLI